MYSIPPGEMPISAGLSALKRGIAAPKPTPSEVMTRALEVATMTLHSVITAESASDCALK